MSLWDKLEERRERKELKKQIDSLMNQYSREKIDGSAFSKGIFDLYDSVQDRSRKK